MLHLENQRLDDPFQLQIPHRKLPLWGMQLMLPRRNDLCQGLYMFNHYHVLDVNFFVSLYNNETTVY